MSSNPLDLAGRIRPGLDILANEIVIALKKRTRFKRNAALYQPGLLSHDPSRSVLDHALARIESCHAELGRYRYAAQEAFSDAANIEPLIRRTPPQLPIMPMQSATGSRIRDFWLSWIEMACEAGEDSDSYGETVTSDVNAMMAMMERINLGKLVAEAKYLESPERVIASGGDAAELKSIIVRHDREQEVLTMARQLAAHYGLEPSLAEACFRFLIGATVELEIEYLRERIAT